LKAGFKASLLFDCAFLRLLPKGGLLRLCGLIENLKLGLLVLQHAQFGTDPRLQIENCFLISRSRNGGDQTLNGGEPVTRVRKRLLAESLLHGVPLARGSYLLLIGRRQRGQTLRRQHGIGTDDSLHVG